MKLPANSRTRDERDPGPETDPIPALGAVAEADVRQSPSPFASSKIMMVDDEPTTLEILEMFLQGEGYENIFTTTDSRQALDLVEQHRPDALLLDVMMPDIGGLEILQAIRGNPTIQHTPVITLTSSTDAETKLRALELGATDFLAKPVDPSELALRLRNTLAAKAYQDRLTYYDVLTGLPNRRLFLERMSHTLRRASARAMECALLHLNLDRFKQINDALGHTAGDALLKEVAERLEGTLRPSDFLGVPGMPDEGHPLSRVGGDEFAMTLPGAGAAERAARVAIRIMSVLSKPFHVEGRELFVTCSIGIALFPSDGDDVESLLGNANVALHHAKGRGRNDFQFYDRSLNLESADRFGLENDLRRALDRKELQLHFQPKVDIASGRVAGVEALMRWQHPERGLVGPNQFIPIAEESSLIGPLGEWALRTSCQQALAWQRAGLQPLSISVNVSIKQLQSGWLVETIRRALNDSGLDPSYLVLELTESVIMDNPAETAKVLGAIKDLGVRISIDDFGTGYSSLSYLKRFPIDELKIDRSFVTGIPVEENDSAIVTAIIRMAHALELSVVAEGVESVQQLEFLANRGCDLYQGYLHSKPVPYDELAPLLERPRLDSTS